MCFVLHDMLMRAGKVATVITELVFGSPASKVSW